MNKLYIALALSLMAIVINSNFLSNNLDHSEKNEEVSLRKEKSTDTSIYTKSDQDVTLPKEESIAELINSRRKTEKQKNATNNRESKIIEDDKSKNITTYNTTPKNTIIDNKELLIILTSIDTDGKKIYELAYQITKKNNKKSAILIVNAMLENYRLGNFYNLEILQETLAEFNSTEAIEELLNAMFSNPEMSYSISRLPDTAKYAIKKAIYKAVDRDSIASKLTSIYQNSTDDENKNRIIEFIYPEVYAMIAVEAYNQGDTELFTKMTQNLTRIEDKHAINGLMILARKIDTNSIDTITKIAETWSGYNLSKNTESLVEDYLSDEISTPKERIIATAILSNIENKEKVLGKAWNYEKNELVKTYINQYRYSDLKDEY